MNKTLKCIPLMAVLFSFASGCEPGGLEVNNNESVKTNQIEAASQNALAMLFSTNSTLVCNSSAASVELTIDRHLQRIVSETLIRHSDTNGIGRGWAVALSVRDGAVLALADCGGDADEPRPFAVTKALSPGLLITPLTVAAALDSRIATPETKISTDRNEPFYSSFRLPADGLKLYGHLTVSNALVHSSCTVLSKLGIIIGPKELYQTFQSFGIGERTALALPMEAAGRLRPAEKWCQIDQSRAPIGDYYGMSATALQMAKAYAILANKGVFLEPFIVRRIRDEKGGVLYEHSAPPKRQVVSVETAKSICAMLEGAVQTNTVEMVMTNTDAMGGVSTNELVTLKSTGGRAFVEGLRVAGKTSTMRIPDADGRGWQSGRYQASFAGFFPADDPQIVLVVYLDTNRTEGEHHFMHCGGGRPAMVFAEVARKLARME